MFTRQTLRRITARLGGLVALASLGLSMTSAQAQNDPRWQHRRGPPQQAQPQAQPQEDPRLAHQRRWQQQQSIQRPAPPPAAPPVFNRPQFQPQPQMQPQQVYRPPMPRIHYGAPRYEPPQPVYRPSYVPPPVIYEPPPRYAGPPLYDVDEVPVYARRYATNRACRVVKQRYRGRIVAVRQCRICRPVVTRDRYGQRIRVDRCAWVRR